MQESNFTTILFMITALPSPTLLRRGSTSTSCRKSEVNKYGPRGGMDPRLHPFDRAAISALDSIIPA